MSELRALLGAAEPVPLSVRRAAVRSFHWLAPDVVPAALVYDSALARRSPDVCAHAEVRLLTFRVAGATIDLTVVSERDGLRVVGLVLPVSPALVAVRRPEGVVATLPTDAFGRFGAAHIPDGLFSVAISFDDADARPPVATEWIRL